MSWNYDRSIGTRNGLRGDRELLFLGAPANHAAKIISSAGRLRLTQTLYEALPDDLQSLCSEVSSGDYQLDPISSAALDELLQSYDLTWDRQASARRIADDKRLFPLKDICYSSAREPIDLDHVSITDNKRVLAASLFADVSGFTGYIDAAQSEAERRRALQVFHAIRREMTQVIRHDFAGLRIQFQGDRVQGLFHLPEDKAQAIAAKTVEAAIGLQSSMEHSLKACLPEADELRLAIGVGLGRTIVSSLGTRGHRDRICLGEAVEQAATYEARCQGGQIGLSKEGYDRLPDDLQRHFTYDRQVQGCVATDLTADKVERAAQAARLYGAGTSVYVQSGAQGVQITPQEVAHGRRIVPSRPYGPTA